LAGWALSCAGLDNLPDYDVLYLVCGYTGAL
jgi:hypothetical protein